MEIKENICALVWTYNRRELLRECLNAILNQTRPLDKIFIVDNDSKDGTEEMILSDFNHNKIEYINIKGKNIGPSACWTIGMKKAIEEGYEWLWCMDDDVEPKNVALEKLINQNIFDSKDIGFLCSRVLWKDHTPAIMNIPSLQQSYYYNDNIYSFDRYIDNNILLIKACSAVSLLIHRNSIINYGYNLKEFFIWGDDIELTQRISKHKSGIYIPDSIVIHKSERNFGSDPMIDDSKKAWRYFYWARNQLYICKSDRGMLHYILFFIKLNIVALKCLFKRKSGYIFLKNIFFGSIASLFFFPKIEYPKR